MPGRPRALADTAGELFLQSPSPVIRKHFIQRVLADEAPLFGEDFLSYSFLPAAGSAQVQYLPRLAECVELCQKLQLAAIVDKKAANASQTTDGGFGEGEIYHSVDKEGQKGTDSDAKSMHSDNLTRCNNACQPAPARPHLRTDIDYVSGLPPTVTRETAVFNGKLLGKLASERPGLQGVAEPRTAFFALLQLRLTRCGVTKLSGSFLPTSGPLLAIIVDQIRHYIIESEHLEDVMDKRSAKERLQSLFNAACARLAETGADVRLQVAPLIAETSKLLGIEIAPFQETSSVLDTNSTTTHSENGQRCQSGVERLDSLADFSMLRDQLDGKSAVEVSRVLGGVLRQHWSDKKVVKGALGLILRSPQIQYAALSPAIAEIQYLVAGNGLRNTQKCVTEKYQDEHDPSVTSLTSSDKEGLLISGLEFLTLVCTLTIAGIPTGSQPAAQDATIVWRLLGLESDFARAEEKLGRAAFQTLGKIIQCADVQNLITALRQTIAAMNDKNSWLLLDKVMLDCQQPNERLFVVGSPLYAKQCRFCRFLLRLAVELRERCAESGAKTTTLQFTEIAQMVNTLLHLLATPEWLRLGREYLEQVVAVLILCLPSPLDFLGTDMERAFRGARPIALQSRLIITGIVLLHVDCADALAPYLVRNTMQGNHQLRVCAKHLLSCLLEAGKIHLDPCIAENVEIEEVCSVAVPPKRLFSELDPLRDGGLTLDDYVYSPQHAELCPFESQHDSTLYKFDYLYQINFNVKALEKLRAEVSEYRFIDGPLSDRRDHLFTGISDARVSASDEEVNHQRKITAVRDLQKFNLIVIASLLDNSVNLGGLARTCEIFNASALVLNDLSATQTTQFQNASVTATQHLNIEQVPRQELPQYIAELKNNGFKIVVLEQSQRSQFLDRVSFPDKVAIIIGNEAHGCPDHILNQADIAVEIPQFGMVRSLNAHVSAALLIWEYVRQKHLGQRGQ